MDNNQFKLVCVIPVYNEQDCIKDVLDIWTTYFDNFFKGIGQYKILLVNDGSRDNTHDILESIKSNYPNLIVVHQQNGGHGNAVMNGYKAAIKMNPEYIFQVDSDNQFLPEDFPKVWEKRTESKFVLGYRKKRYDDFNRLIITRILRLANALFFRTVIIDSNVPYRLIKATYLNHLIQVLGFEPFAPNIFLAVLAKRDGQNLFEIPVTHKERETGQVSIIKMRLLKVCARSMNELFKFSFSANKKLKELKALENGKN